MPGAFAGFGYHGNGVVMASYSGAILSDLVTGTTLTFRIQKQCERFQSVFLWVHTAVISYVHFTSGWRGRIARKFYQFIFSAFV